MKIFLSHIFFLVLFLPIIHPSGISAYEGTPIKSHQTLDGAIIVGFQGWFACPGDGRRKSNWFHWFRGEKPDVNHLRVDLVPDVSEFGEEELCRTEIMRRDGAPLMLFSDQNPNTVSRQFSWMKQYEIDVAALQRFIVDLPMETSIAGRDAIDRVLANVREAAERYDVGFYIMYDIANAPPDHWAELLIDDWKELLAAGISGSSAYQRHAGRPVLAIAGVGSSDRPGTAQQVKDLISKLREISESYGGVTLIASTATNWRTGDGDAKTSKDWEDVYGLFDVLSPWTVGRYRDENSLSRFVQNRMVPDMKTATDRRQLYMPVIFPGFSWHNLQFGQSNPISPLDSIPRRAGQFLRSQAEKMTRAGAKTLYVAMFDEVDEGTAIFKLASDPSKLPKDIGVVRNEDVRNPLPPDFYLRQLREIKRELLNEGSNK